MTLIFNIIIVYENINTIQLILKYYANYIYDINNLITNILISTKNIDIIKILLESDLYYPNKLLLDIIIHNHEHTNYIFNYLFAKEKCDINSIKYCISYFSVHKLSNDKLFGLIKQNIDDKNIINEVECYKILDIKF